MSDSWMFYKGIPIDFEIPEGVVPPIYIIGDSHINTLNAAFPKMFYYLNHVSSTAYHIGELPFIEESLKSTPKGSKVLIYFGEIDCRHYAPKLALKQNETIESVISLIVTKYTSVVLAPLLLEYKLIIPSPYVCPDDLVHPNGYERILEAKEVFTERLSQFCEKQNLIFVDLFHEAFKWLLILMIHLT